MPDWLWLITAAIFGALVVIIVPVILAIFYLKPFEKVNTEQCTTTPITLPQETLNELTRGAGCTPEGALNAILQFIFQQSTADTRWLRRRMTSELAELLAKTSSGKIFESLTLRSLEMGSEFPSLSNLRLLSGELEEDGARLRSLDLKFDLTYDGNFNIDVDAVMLLGKVANVSVTVESICGTVRVMFRRTPYTHWAIAFEGPPRLELKVRGRFQGRQLKPRLASLIAAHIRRAIAQRHTLPNYKIRYKPFFPKSEPGSVDSDDGPTPQGLLTVRMIEMTRLQASDNYTSVRVSIAVDEHAWVSLHHDVLVQDLILPCVSGPLGLVCCQTVGNVRVENVVPMSPSHKAGLKKDDLILAVDNKIVTNVAQVAKYLRAVERRAVTVRIQRGSHDNRKEDPLEPKKMKANFSFRRVSEVMEGVRLQSMKTATSKTSLQESDSPSKTIEPPNDSQKADQTKRPDPPTPSHANLGLRKRRCSVENKDSDSSTGSTPSTSGASTPLKVQRKHEIPIIKTDSSECKEIQDSDDNKNVVKQFWTRSGPLKPIMAIDEETEFTLNESHKYLNLNVWARGCDKEEVLLGYLNIPLVSLLLECQDSTVPHHMKRFQFLPPDVDIKFSKTHKLSSHAGFEPCLCFGDVLVWWEWQPSSSTTVTATPSPASPPKVSRPSVRSSHDFVRTHFNSSTQCDFCNRKIWLKDALQCRACGLCCHKKCLAKCQEASPCVPRQERVPSPGSVNQEGIPDTIDPDSDDEMDRKNSLDVHEEGSSAISVLVAGLRRAGSAHSLSAPRSSISSRSLPPSPSHTPRKQSLEQITNPFSGSGATWLRYNDVAELLQLALQCSLPPDAMLAAARDSAPELASQLKPQQIHEMLSAVREELSRQDTPESASTPEGNDNNEARACALTALMLHCCAAAQIAQSNEESPT